MCLQVSAVGVAVEVAVNGLPVLRLAEGAPPRCLPVHEYLLAGENRISLVVAPPPPGLDTAPPQPRVAPAEQMAVARLLLMREGRTPESPSTRELAAARWAVAAGEACEAPTAVHQDVNLPVGFPRWRWLDAPVMPASPKLDALVLAWLQKLAFELSRGRPDTLLASSRLKLEELGLAYQWPAGQAAERLKAGLQALHESGALAALQPPAAADVVLRPVAGGRLIDCLNALGEPALQVPGNTWPLRVAVVEGQVYVLR
jgi:hypothetical protein